MPANALSAMPVALGSAESRLTMLLYIPVEVYNNMPSLSTGKIFLKIVPSAHMRLKAAHNDCTEVII